MHNKTTLNPAIAAGIATTFQRPIAFAKLADVTGYQLGRMLEGLPCDAVAIRRVEQAWAVMDPFTLRKMIYNLSAQQTTVDRVAMGKILAALDVAYEALTGVELIAVGGGD